MTLWAAAGPYAACRRRESTTNSVFSAVGVEVAAGSVPSGERPVVTIGLGAQVPRLGGGVTVTRSVYGFALVEPWYPLTSMRRN